MVLRHSPPSARVHSWLASDALAPPPLPSPPPQSQRTPVFQTTERSVGVRRVSTQARHRMRYSTLGCPPVCYLTICLHFTATPMILSPVNDPSRRLHALSQLSLAYPPASQLASQLA